MNQVIHGDCLEVMPSIPDKSIDMILCDLPYGTTACKWDTVIPFEPLWKEYKRLIKDNGAIVLTASQPFTSALVMSNCNMFRYEWVWEKENAPTGLHAKTQPMKVHENVLVFGGVRYNPQKTKGHKDAPSGKNKSSDIYGEMKPKQRYKLDRSGERYPRSVQRFNNVWRDERLHPTQKPVVLFEYLIKTYTNKGETVLDNCAGSGTTAIACLNTNRNYILIEKEKGYVDIINKRIAEHEQQLALC